MANTTFSGAVRSENGFKVVSKDGTTGTVTTSFTLDGSGMQVAPVTLSDADTSLTAATHGGRVVVVPAITADRTLTLPIWTLMRTTFPCTQMVTPTQS